MYCSEVRDIEFIYSYFERGWRKICARDSPKWEYGIRSILCSWHCSCRSFDFCCLICFSTREHTSIAPLAILELKTTHNTFQDCRLHFFKLNLYTNISRKVGGKSPRDNPDSYCEWFWVHFSSQKFERIAREAMDICLRELKEGNKSRFDSCSRREQCIVGFHMTSLKFKLKNYRSYRDFTFTMH